MKAQKEWLKKQRKDIREYMSPNYYAGLEDGWKAALEWIKGMARDNKLHNADIKIWDEIDEELEL